MSAINMAEYVLARYHRRKEEAVKQLGGKCVQCGTTEDLEFDHIDSATKGFTIGSKLAGVSESRLQKELEKCQLLCHTCHITKHATAKRTHGTISSSRYCNCTECRKAVNAYQRERKRRKKAGA